MHTARVPIPLEQMDRSTPAAAAQYWDRLWKLTRKRQAVLSGLRGWYERIDRLSPDDRLRLMYGEWIDRLDEWEATRPAPKSSTREFGGPGARVRDAPYSRLAGPRPY